MPDLTISKLARCAGVDVETLRFYEREGLLERPERGDCGSPEEVRWLTPPPEQSPLMPDRTLASGGALDAVSRPCLWAVLHVAALLALLPLPSARAEGAAPAVASRAVVRIEGMTCVGCNRGVSTALSELAFVRSVEASFAEGAACIELAGDLDEAAVRRAITEAGYTPESIEGVDACPRGLRGRLRTPWEGRMEGVDAARISQGEEVDVAAHLAPGKYTLIDYGASWCGPCHAAARQLAAYLGEHDDVAVRVIDLGGETAEESYAQPVVAQHLKYVQGIPWLVVHDPDGKILVQTPSPNKAIAAIDRHRARHAGARR